mmetsp:Transcript_94844/g.138487  ORF Transcript_94844/g.138487 Transcript_94844/m.138487 type:complete len:87 (+) Transcript_94844:1426-1686(+)
MGHTSVASGRWVDLRLPQVKKDEKKEFHKITRDLFGRDPLARGSSAKAPSPLRERSAALRPDASTSVFSNQLLCCVETEPEESPSE